MQTEDRPMPLRDHFHPPLTTRASRQGFHGGWPAMIVCDLINKLPSRYAAEPRVRLGTEMEGVACSESEEPDASCLHAGDVMAWQVPQPSVTAETTLLNADEYEVRVYDEEREQRLVAAIEIVSPANKDR